MRPTFKKTQDDSWVEPAFSRATQVIGIDPGKTTGYFLWSYRWTAPKVYENEVSPSGHVRGEQRDVVSMMELDTVDLAYWFTKDADMGTAVAIESFVMTGASTETDALEIIGWLKGHCLSKRIPFKLYPPSAKKGRNNAQLKALGWWTTQGGGHANDAARHALNLALEYDLLKGDARVNLKNYLTKEK